MSITTFALTLLLAVTASANPFVAESKNTLETAYISTLLSHAKETSNSQIRGLAENKNNVNIDLTEYSVKYEKCQNVMHYDDTEAEKSEDTVLMTSHFVVFRLCPASSCSSCSSGYGEYLIDLDTYLETTVAWLETNQTNMCTLCEADCVDGATSEYVDCSTCATECEKIDNMKANGYVDATNFIQCTMIYDDANTGESLYAGVVCTSSGGKIKIGVFTDNACTNLDSSKNPETYLVDGNGYAMKLSYALLKSVYDSSTCIPCKYSNDKGEVQNSESCATLYYGSAKCESKGGFANGIASDENYANQLAEESLVCNFISSINSGTYNEQGQVVVSGASGRVSSSKSGVGGTSRGQKFALSFMILGTVLLAVYAAMLHAKLTKSHKSTLTHTGGALA